MICEKVRVVSRFYGLLDTVLFRLFIYGRLGTLKLSLLEELVLFRDL